MSTNSFGNTPLPFFISYGSGGASSGNPSPYFVDLFNNQTVAGTKTWQVMAQAGVAETLAKWSVSDDAVSYLSFINGTASDSRFQPMIQTRSDTSTDPSLTLNPIVTAARDTGTIAIMVVNFQRSGAAAVTVRPLFEWQNNGTTLAQMIPLNSGADSSLLFRANGIGAPTFTTRSNGERIALSNSIDGTHVDYSIGVESGNIWYAAPTSGSGTGHKFYGGITLLMRLDGNGNTIQTQQIATSGSPTLATWTGAAHTTLAAGVECPDININLARTVQFSMTPPTTQRAVRIQAPTYSCDTAAQIIATAVTFDVSGPPVGGTNVTITNALAANINGRIDTSDTFRVTGGSTTSGAGAGVEIAYSSSIGVIRSFARSGSTYQPLDLDGLTVALRPNSTTMLSVDANKTTTSGGRIQKTRTALTTPVTVVTSDWYIESNLSTPGAVIVNLPATPTTGQEFVIADGKGDANTNNITITPAAGNIDGSATKVINTAYGVIRMIYNGTIWKTI